MTWPIKTSHRTVRCDVILDPLGQKQRLLGLASEPMRTAVTPRAGARVAPSACMAHL
jgi:hypothetical protein